MLRPSAEIRDASAQTHFWDFWDNEPRSGLPGRPEAAAGVAWAMDFASSILQSAASSLAAAAKPSLASHYAPVTAHTGDRDRAPLQVGVWRVQRAQHVSTGKQVSIWSADKHHLVQQGTQGRRGGAGGAGARDRERDADRLRQAIDILKKEVRSLGHLGSSADRR